MVLHWDFDHGDAKDDDENATDVSGQKAKIGPAK